MYRWQAGEGVRLPMCQLGDGCAAVEVCWEAWSSFKGLQRSSVPREPCELRVAIQSARSTC